MKIRLVFFSILVVAVVFAVASRPFSRGMKLIRSAEKYSLALSHGHAVEARGMMIYSMAEGLSREFLSKLEGTTVPADLRYDGSDARGLRMVGSDGEGGSRVIWFSVENRTEVTGDTAVDKILGSAVILCRENALVHPDGSCPVSGIPYEFNEETHLVVCLSGHLGDGITISSSACTAKRDSVIIELAEYLGAGYPYPETLEEMFTLSGEEYGRRGGYRCPDHGYKYYELQDGMIYCPFHEEFSVIPVTQ